MCSLVGAVLRVLRAASVTAVDLLTGCPAARDSLLALTDQPPVSGWKWQERVGRGGVTRRGEWSMQELRPPPAASLGPFPTTLRFRGLPEGPAEFTAVMLTVAIYYRKY